jgi:hypothetical protein
MTDHSLLKNNHSAAGLPSFWTTIDGRFVSEGFRIFPKPQTQPISFNGEASPPRRKAHYVAAGFIDNPTSATNQIVSEILPFRYVCLVSLELSSH